MMSGRRRLMAQLRPAEGGFFWRMSKADVAHELALPPQSHRTTFLTLSAIERHFYMRQHQVTPPRMCLFVTPSITVCEYSIIFTGVVLTMP